MDVCAAGGDKGGLRDEEEDPRREGGAVDVNDQAWQRRAKNAGQEIAAREADKDRDEHEKRHDRKEVVVVTAAGQAGYGANRLVRLGYECCQDASVRTWTGEECASTWEVHALYPESVWGALADKGNRNVEADLKTGLYDRLEITRHQGLEAGFVAGLVISFSASARAWAAGISAPDLSR